MDEGPSNHDEALLARLNAIRKSSVTFHSSNSEPKQPSTSPDALLARFQNLYTRPSPQSTTSTNLPPYKRSPSLNGPPPSPSIEELIAQIGPDDQFSLDISDIQEARTLLEEAKHALPSDPSKEPTPRKGIKAAVAPMAPSYERDESQDGDKNEDEEAALSLQQILDSITLQQPSDPQTPSLPSPPKTSLPSQSPTLAPLLPSTPTTHPSHTTPTTYSDAEIASWCAICCADATVRCPGCAGELYCRRCWDEGHVGSHVPVEERGHRWEWYPVRRV